MTPIERTLRSDAIVCSGARIPCGVPVILWGESKLSFQGRPRRKSTRVVTLHWTGGEGGAQQVHRTMTSRKVSVPFFVDAHGVVWQFCDADRETVHCPGFNKTGIGIEIQNRGSALHVKLPKGLTRATVREQVGGRMLEYSDFTPQQIVSVVTLVRALCGAFNLPVQVPVDARGRVITSALSTVEVARFSGVVGHLHAGGKDDPGGKLLKLIHDQETEDARA